MTTQGKRIVIRRGKIYLPPEAKHSALPKEPILYSAWSSAEDTTEQPRPVLAGHGTVGMDNVALNRYFFTEVRRVLYDTMLGGSVPRIRAPDLYMHIFDEVRGEIRLHPMALERFECNRSHSNLTLQIRLRTRPLVIAVFNTGRYRLMISTSPTISEGRSYADFCPVALTIGVTDTVNVSGTSLGLDYDLMGTDEHGRIRFRQQPSG